MESRSCPHICVELFPALSPLLSADCDNARVCLYRWQQPGQGWGIWTACSTAHRQETHFENGI